MVLDRPAGGSPVDLPGIEIREARPEDAGPYERDIGTDLAATVRQRLQGPGITCWLALNGAWTVHASWVATRQAWLGEADRFLMVPPGDAYIYESFTSPEMRGRGVYPAVLAAISSTLGARGISRLWIAAETTNRPSLRAIEKAGFTRSFDITVRRRLGRAQVTVPKGAGLQLRNL